ncbi:MAG: hypothetical protein RI907_364 [Pseudomonadota bacterium]|jgi:hypothetical protein
MMNCQRYIFELTSGRLREAGLATQAQARLHRLVCVHCRAFTRNDQQLERVLEGWRQRAEHDGPGEPPSTGQAPP